MKPFIKISLVILTLIWSCTKFVPSEPENSPIRNFDLLWNEFDAYYSSFTIKNIDWDSLYKVYRPQVTDNDTDIQLFNIIAAMLSNLNDGHVALVAPFNAVFSNEKQKSSRPENFNLDNILNNYFSGPYQVAGNNRFIFGHMKSDTEIGYIYISSFEDVDYARVDKWVAEIDKVIKILSGTKGIIIDIRDNGRGDSFNSDAIADRFTSTKNLYGYDFSRNGPSHNDFSRPYPLYIIPSGNTYSNPVALLTNRSTASASERFLLAMKTIPNVIVIGDTTEGALPHALPRELPNGWSYRVTVGVVNDANNRNYEGIGIAPDSLVVISSHEIEMGIDPIIDKAISMLNISLNPLQLNNNERNEVKPKN